MGGSCDDCLSSYSKGGLYGAGYRFSDWGVGKGDEKTVWPCVRQHQSLTDGQGQ